MTVSSDLYRSWRSEGSYFSDMLDCGDRYNRWVEIALEHVPPNILDEYKERLVYVSTADRDGCRLARKYCEEREVILVSERILPKKGVSLGDPDVRYFVFVILHETVHAIKRHQSPKFDSLSESDNISSGKRSGCPSTRVVQLLCGSSGKSLYATINNGRSKRRPSAKSRKDE